MDNQFAKYCAATAEELLEEPAFRRWALRGEGQDFWQAFLVRYPGRQVVVEEAVRLLRDLEADHRQVTLPAAEADALYAAIRRRISEQDEPKGPLPNPRRRKRASVYPALAIAATLLLLLGLLWWTWPAPERVYATGNGQQARVYLPDSSLVELNANSRITFPASWKWGRPRTVKLRGEAFFTVRKQKPSGSLFTVETGAVRVQVLGTRFNVNSRRGRTAVALEEGSVRLATARPSGAEQRLVMQPGEVVTYRADSGLVRRPDAELESLLSWRRGTLLFKGATLEQVAERYEELYGKPVLFSDASLKTIKVQLSVPVNDAGQFINTLRILFEKSLRIEESDGGIYIQALR